MPRSSLLASTAKATREQPCRRNRDIAGSLKLVRGGGELLKTAHNPLLGQLAAAPSRRSPLCTAFSLNNMHLSKSYWCRRTIGSATVLVSAIFIATACLLELPVSGCGTSSAGPTLPACSVPPRPQSVQCGGGVCSATTPVCCATKFQTVQPYGVADGYCASARESCFIDASRDNGSAYECDDTTDCPSGMICCVNESGSGGAATCRTQCLSTVGATEWQACHDNCECAPSSTTCTSAGPFAGFCCLPSGAYCEGASADNFGDTQCCSGACVPSGPRQTVALCK